MSRNLGSFGRAPEPVGEPDTFEYFGATFRVNPEFGQLNFIDFMEHAGSLDDNSAEAAVQVKEALRITLHPEDFDPFWVASLANRQTTTDLMGLFEAILKAVAETESERPTGRPSVSSDGPGVILPSSVSPPADPAMERFAGRPDQQAAVLMMRRASA